MCERQINLIIARNPHLINSLNRNKNHPLIRKYSHIPFDITNVTDDYKDTISINKNCTNNDNNIEIILPLFTTIPCGMSLMCLISLMAYTLIKPLFNKKQILELYLYKYKLRSFFIQLILLGVS